MLTTVLLLIAVSLALSVALTPIVRGAAVRWRFVDLPDNSRKIHRKPLPRIGGAAIFVAYFGSCLAVATLLAHSGFAAGATLAAVKSVAPAALLVFLVGFLDDVIGLKPWHKLAAEIVAGVLAISAGICIGGVPPLAAHPVIGAFCTIVWLVLCTNAINLIDGLDGLAAGIALLATGAVLVASLVHGNFALTIAAAPLVGALLGFLVFNFNPASIFLGDSGSLLIGFLLGCYSVLWSSKSATMPKMAAPMIALAVPLVDTTLAIVRRFLRAQPIFSPDRSHVHHRLLARGFTHRQAVLLLYIAAGIAGAFSVCLIVAGKRWEPVILVAFAAGAMFGIQRLGYAEIETARRILTGKAFRREVRAQLAVRSFEDKLAAAATANDCWAVIQQASQDFGFHPIRMKLGGQMFADEDESVPISSWALRMPISQNDWIELFHELGPVGHASAVVPFAETIRKVLSAKRAALARQQQATFAASAGVYRGLTSNAHRI
jgi:UDP-GlcNAc:undecaprenyl-phosphate GlcNAc-1-phosphate transferase